MNRGSFLIKRKHLFLPIETFLISMLTFEGFSTGRAERWKESRVESGGVTPLPVGVLDQSISLLTCTDII